MVEHGWMDGGVKDLFCHPPPGGDWCVLLMKTSPVVHLSLFSVSTSIWTSQPLNSHMMFLMSHTDHISTVLIFVARRTKTTMMFSERRVHCSDSEVNTSHKQGLESLALICKSSKGTCVGRRGVQDIRLKRQVGRSTRLRVWKMTTYPKHRKRV